jgi:hypothetical protein
VVRLLLLDVQFGGRFFCCMHQAPGQRRRALPVALLPALQVPTDYYSLWGRLTHSYQYSVTGGCVLVAQLGLCNNNAM